MSKPDKANSITVTIGSEWGREHTPNDGDKYAEYVQRSLSAVYPSFVVMAHYDATQLNTQTICLHSGKAINDADVVSTLTRTFKNFCLLNWETK